MVIGTRFKKHCLRLVVVNDAGSVQYTNYYNSCSTLNKDSVNKLVSVKVAGY